MTVFVVGLWLSMQIGTGKEYCPDLPSIVIPLLPVFLQCSLHGRRKHNSREQQKYKKKKQKNITYLIIISLQIMLRKRYYYNISQIIVI